MKFHNLLILILLILNFIDYDTTARIIDAGGTEANPIMNYVIIVTGALWPLLVIKTAIMGVLWLGFYLVAEVTAWMIFILSVAMTVYTGVVARSVQFCMEYGLF